jgi:hypothetical protein
LSPPGLARPQGLGPPSSPLRSRGVSAMRSPDAPLGFAPRGPAPADARSPAAVVPRRGAGPRFTGWAQESVPDRSPAGLEHPRPATVSWCCPRQAAGGTTDPTCTRFPKDAPPGGAAAGTASGGLGSVRVAWQSSSRLLDETRSGPKALAGHRSGPKALAALTSRPEGRYASPSGAKPAGGSRLFRPGPARRRARGAVARRMWPFVAFGRSTDARFGAAVRNGAARPVARSEPARKRGPRSRGAFRPRPVRSRVDRRARAAGAARARLPRCCSARGRAAAPRARWRRTAGGAWGT